jgi:curved DNA-binding protein CbpA
MIELYDILGVSEDATDEEVERVYLELKGKYSLDRFLDGEAGNEAAKKLTRLENAYNEIMAIRKGEKDGSYLEIESAIKKGNIALAQEKLDAYSTRDAEWHYLQSVVFYKKNWINESLKQLEIAMNMDTDNKKYSDSYAKLKEKIAFNEKQFNAGNTNANVNEEAPSQMGGSSNECCSTCATWCCMNAVFNLCLNACCHC